MDRLPIQIPTASLGLSVQLYTIREAIQENLYGSLKKLSDIGFKHVETAFWPEEISLDTAAGYLQESGLSVSSCHTEIPTKENISKIVKQAQAYDCNKIIWHGWPEDTRYSTLEGTRELIKQYNTGNKLARDKGLQFGLHNHWWEYKTRLGGKFIYEILLDELDETIFFETDIYWVKVAGQNPVTIINQLKNRTPLLHLKDGPAQWNDQLSEGNPDPMTPLGKGTIDIPAILNAAGDHVQWLVIEMDKSAINVFDALNQTVDYLSGFETIRLS